MKKNSHPSPPPPGDVPFSRIHPNKKNQNNSYTKQSSWTSGKSCRFFLGSCRTYPVLFVKHDDVTKWKHFSHYWPFVREVLRLPVNSQHKGQWRVALLFPLVCARTNCWINNRDADDLRLHRAHYDVIVMDQFVISGKKGAPRNIFKVFQIVPCVISSKYYENPFYPFPVMLLTDRQTDIKQQTDRLTNIGENLTLAIPRK